MTTEEKLQEALEWNDRLAQQLDEIVEALNNVPVFGAENISYKYYQWKEKLEQDGD